MFKLICLAAAGLFMNMAMTLDVPRFVWGLIKYGSQREAGSLFVGSTAPSVPLHELSTGKQKPLSDWVGDKPLVLIFGSCT